MIEVKNGTRVPVEFVRGGRGYAGLAAVEHEALETARVLFSGRVGDLRGVKAGLVDGREARVTDVSASSRVPSIVVVTVEFGKRGEA